MHIPPPPCPWPAGPTAVLIVGGAGYVGSRLATALPALGYRVTTLDPRPASVPGAHIQAPYQAMSAEDLAGYRFVLWFAGHSSVRQAVADPGGALRNNLADLWAFQARLRPSQGFVYASSASVYTMLRPEVCSETFRPQALLNVYDQTKAWFDTLMTGPGAATHFWGLRLGTVAGASGHLRTDTVFNAMTLDARRHGNVRLTNEDVHRGVLGLPDLVRAVDAIMSRPVPPGLYNLASLHTTLGALATGIAGQFGARITIGAPTSGYDFRMSCAKFCAAAGFRFTDTVESLVAELIAAEETARPVPA